MAIQSAFTWSGIMSGSRFWRALKELFEKHGRGLITVSDQPRRVAISDWGIQSWRLDKSVSTFAGWRENHSREYDVRCCNAMRCQAMPYVISKWGVRWHSVSSYMLLSFSLEDWRIGKWSCCAESRERLEESFGGAREGAQLWLPSPAKLGLPPLHVGFRGHRGYLANASFEGFSYSKRPEIVRAQVTYPHLSIAAGTLWLTMGIRPIDDGTDSFYLSRTIFVRSSYGDRYCWKSVFLIFVRNAYSVCTCTIQTCGEP